MQLLLIEPDKILGSSYKLGLTEAGFRVRWAQSAEVAIHLTDTVRPNLIVLEPKLAAHSGVEFLHELRSYEDWSSIKVVIYSSVPKYSFGINENAWNKFGVVRYLEKSKTSVSQLAAICTSILEVS